MQYQAEFSCAVCLNICSKIRLQSVSLLRNKCKSNLLRTLLNLSLMLKKLTSSMVPTSTGKPEKIGEHFLVREF